MDDMGLKCYFSKNSLLVKSLNNNKKIDKNTAQENPIISRQFIYA